MTDFTPPPWTIYKCPCGDEICNQFTISVQGSVGFDEADAHLIKAAPKMYAALKDLRDLCLRERLIPASVSYMKEAEVALSNARGET